MLIRSQVKVRNLCRQGRPLASRQVPSMQIQRQRIAQQIVNFILRYSRFPAGISPYLTKLLTADLLPTVTAPSLIPITTVQYLAFLRISQLADVIRSPLCHQPTHLIHSSSPIIGNIFAIGRNSILPPLLTPHYRETSDGNYGTKPLYRSSL